MDIVEELEGDQLVRQFDSAGRQIEFMGTPSALDIRAAAEIRRLRLSNARMREALAALHAECCLAGHDRDKDYLWPKVMEAARSALTSQGEGT